MEANALRAKYRRNRWASTGWLLMKYQIDRYTNVHTSCKGDVRTYNGEGRGKKAGRRVIAHGEWDVRQRLRYVIRLQRIPFVEDLLQQDVDLQWI